MSSSGNAILDAVLWGIVAMMGTNFLADVFKAAITSLSGRGKEKRERKKQEAVADEIERRSIHYWREMTYETRRVALDWGVPREELPEIRKSLDSPDDTIL